VHPELAALAGAQGFVGGTPSPACLVAKMLLLLVGAVLAFGDARDQHAASSRDVPIQEEDEPEARRPQGHGLAREGGGG
jgi:hypothetical protein